MLAQCTLVHMHAVLTKFIVDIDRLQSRAVPDFHRLQVLGPVKCAVIVGELVCVCSAWGKSGLVGLDP